MQALLVPQNFECHYLVELVVIRLKDGPERSFADLLFNLESVADMVLGRYDVLLLIIVKAKVVLFGGGRFLGFGSFVCVNVVDCLKF